MTSYHFLMDLAIILLSTKLMGLSDTAVSSSAGCRCAGCRVAVGSGLPGYSSGDGLH